MDRTAAALLIRLAIVAGILVAVVALAALRARRRAAYEPREPIIPADVFPRGVRAPLTAFYFTSRLCAACAETPGVVREADPNVPVVPLAVHDRPDLARAFGIFETPTLLLADAQGRIRYARVGNPDPAELRMYVIEALDSSERVPGPGPGPALSS